MCWLFKKAAGNTIPAEYCREAYKYNKHGFGLSYSQDNQLQVFKTMDYNEFLSKLATLDAFEVVGHFRAASAGSIDLGNAHPFVIKSNTALFHNGTITSLRNSPTCPTTGCSDSDTKTLANLLESCNYSHISDVAPLIQTIIGDYGNKLVFMEHDGTTTIFNKHLGIEEDGNWYSNDYHIPIVTNYNYVFVYGTLKEGYRNNLWLGVSELEGDGTTSDKWAMIHGPGFPYLLGRHPDGHHIKGEIYSCTDATLAHLDRLEGTPYHYHREVIDVDCGDFVYPCITYVKTNIDPEDLEEEFIDVF